jgi:enterochelin esterase-like enzyme
MLAVEGIAHEWHEFEGSHDWEYWRARLPDALWFRLHSLS